MNIIETATNFAKEEYKKNDPLHQWSHAEAVLKRAMLIAEKLKGVDYELLQLAAIFHDIDYHSESSFEENYRKHLENSIKVAEKFLRDNNYPEKRIAKVKQIILDHSTPHRKKLGDSKIIEGKILYDADKSILSGNDKYEKYRSLFYFDEALRLIKNPS